MKLEVIILKPQQDVKMILEEILLAYPSAFKAARCEASHLSGVFLWHMVVLSLIRRRNRRYIQHLLSLP